MRTTATEPAANGRRATLQRRIQACIGDAASPTSDLGDEHRALLQDLCSWQSEVVPVYRRWLSAHAAQAGTLPLPTEVFRHAQVASFPPELSERCFLSSGTTGQARARHRMRSLALYDSAATRAAAWALFADQERLPLHLLAPAQAAAPASSLSHMLACFRQRFGQGEADVQVWQGDGLDIGRWTVALRAAEKQSTPVALLGTSFAFVHAEDALGGQRFALPPGSRLMHTGGFKGKSRYVPPGTLRRLLSERFGLPPSHIVTEYGMTELSSQCYEPGLYHALTGKTLLSEAVMAEARRWQAVHPGSVLYWAPPWLSVSVVCPAHLTPLPAGAIGLLRVQDPANLDSVADLLTADAAIAVGPQAFLLLGRAPGAAPRGCSLGADAALTGSS